MNDNITYVASHTKRLNNGFVAVVDYDGVAREFLAPGDPKLEDIDEALWERCCHVCDGLGHGYIIGWRETETKGAQPVYSGPCTVYEEISLY